MIAGHKILAIITARGGSKGIPRKNLADLAGRPLIAWTIEAGLKSRYVDRVILTTDDEEIAAAAANLGCDIPFLRAPHLATDEATSADVVVDALTRVPGYDLFVLLQPTSPLRTAQDVDDVLELLRDGAQAGVSVTEAMDHPWLTYRWGDNGRLVPYVTPPSPGESLRRQDLPRAYVLNGAVYAARVATFLGRPRFIGADTAAHLMPGERSIDIDTPEDLARAQALLDRRPAG